MKFPKIQPFTHHRREFIAKAVMDVLKFIVATAFASSFFVTFALPVRIVIAVGLPILFMAAWFIYPARGGQQ